MPKANPFSKFPSLRSLALALCLGAPAALPAHAPDLRSWDALAAQLSAGKTADAKSATADLKAILDAQLAPLSAVEKTARQETFFPAGTSLAFSRVDAAGRGEAYLVLPDAFLGGGATDFWFDQAEFMRHGIAELVEGLETLEFYARAESADDFRPLHEFLPAAPEGTARDKPAVPEAALKVLVPQGARGNAQPQGALSGASIFVSPGHGWFYDSSNARWQTQRFNSGDGTGVVEDHSNAEIINQYLLPYLWNAGARVYTIRERDMNTEMVIVDTPAAQLTGNWTTNATGGWNNGSYLSATTVAGNPTATARFTPTIPSDGYYGVYVHYRPAPNDGNTVRDGRIQIHHTGGTTLWTQDMTRDGYTWKYVGTYYFEAGSDPAAGSVEVTNQSATAGQIVTADAVRFGGGMGDWVDGGSVSGYPRFEESGLYYAQFMGKTGESGTVGVLPRYAAWECETEWEGGANNNAIYLSWHSNGFNTTVRGFETFAYGSGSFEGVAGGDVLRDRVHDKMVRVIQQFDPAIPNRGKKLNRLGEISPNSNDEMPAALVETVFHDNQADSDALLTPEFRQLVARAAYQGIVDFFHDYYFQSRGNSEFNDRTYLPEPPTHLSVTAAPGGAVRVAWNAPPSGGVLGAAATGYRVYRSRNGYGFDNGTAVTGTSFEFTPETSASKLYLRVAATNSGGESLPTETLGIGPLNLGTPQILVVNGFDRLDRGQNIRVPATFYPGNITQRGLLNRMNTFSYAVEHGEAIAAAGFGFASASNEAVASGAVSLGGYDAVVWISGEESTADDTFNAAEQSAMIAYLGAGGKVFVSGAEVAYDLVAQNNGAAFFRNSLRTDFSRDDAGTYAAKGSAGGIFDGVSLLFDNGSAVYDVDFPDVLAPSGAQSEGVLFYDAASPTIINDFDTLGGWRDPNFSGSTDAGVSDDSTFTIVNNPRRQGTGAGELAIVWGTGAFVRNFNGDATNPFSPDIDVSYWVNGDASGARVRLAVRDEGDDDILAGPWIDVDFTGWRQIVWENVRANPGNEVFFQAAGGDGAISGATVRIDSIQVQKGSAGAQSLLVFDEMTILPDSEVSTDAAAVAWRDPASGAAGVVMGFPFETIVDEGGREDVMARVLGFLDLAGTPGNDGSAWMLY
ncbi:MAG: N-acetylmuramoyl-L-alanine amidase [Sumerlaeia bacterium]